MDRVSWIGLTLCIIALFLWLNYSEQQWGARNRARQAALATNALSAERFTRMGGDTNSPYIASGDTNAPYRPVPTISAPVTGGVPPLRSPMDMPPEKKEILENDEVKVTFTSYGGGIHRIELLKQKDTATRNVFLNDHGVEPVMNLVGLTDDLSLVSYTAEKIDANTITFTHTTSKGLKISRTYKIQPNYVISLTQSLTNTTDAPMNLPPSRLNVGVSGPLHQHDGDLYTGASWLDATNATYHHYGVMSFLAGNFLGYQYAAARSSIPSTEGVPVQWAAVKNQFFAIIVSAPKDAPFVSADTHPFEITRPYWTTAYPVKGIKAEAWAPARKLDPGATVSTSYTIFGGPKEEPLLAKLPTHEMLIMEFGWTGVIVRPLQWLMRVLHGMVGNWGLSIILLTVIIKGTFWPLQSIANTSMKKMQALAPKLKELQERYKDQPEKVGPETMKMYRDYGVNPVAGCLPLLIQMPVFIGLYFMLQGATELRGQSFLWAADLTQPDTVYTIHLLGLGVDINPFVLLMAATQMMLMRMMPSGGDPMQAKMMQLMPLVMLAFMYYFASGLALYWTVNNLISVVQTYINLRKPVPLLKRVPKLKPAGAK